MCLLMTKTDGVDLWLESLCRFFKIMLTQPLHYLLSYYFLFGSTIRNTNANGKLVMGLNIKAHYERSRRENKYRRRSKRYDVVIYTRDFRFSTEGKEGSSFWS